ncbi:response regulator transcription factor [Chitinophaga japonensis]|uniref:LuxR family two component transcriptional regulator n=1 Tax=Chitinophaga japonensis TaxID=104662 RepID=A0A562T406_CHIJA|nr:response regulator transcription factor [Chitinophaga japonensis]TWI88269.1 LuxR family two component transcriptional regulator [Chitinophaga japonensis]
MKTVLIADDHTIVRLGVLLIVKSMFLNAQVYEAETLDQTIAQLETRPFDLLILDINIPGGNNLQMINALRLRQPNIKILMFSGYEEQLFALNYIQAGADGYLVKHSPEEEIRTALRMVMNNEKYISAAVKDQLLARLQQPRPPLAENPISALSAREKEVMNLLVKGESIGSIADMLHLQITTVSTYKSRIFEKMGTANVIELAEKVRLYNISPVS